MTEIVNAGTQPRTVHPSAIPIREFLPWTLLAVALLALIAFVSVAEGTYIHELFHDGRHLLAFPCH